VSDAGFGRDRDRIADVAIDRAVREIMSAETGPAFRQRVMTRILAEPAPPSRSWLPHLAVAAAALVVLIVALAWPRQQAVSEPATAAAGLTPRSPSPTDTTASSMPATPAPASAPPRAPGATTAAAPVRPAPSVTRTRVPAPPRGMVEAASIETAAGVGVAAAREAVDAVEAPPLPPAAPGSLRMSAIPLAPIVISEIVIEPLGDGGR
jgi:hypothetical protein